MHLLQFLSLLKILIYKPLVNEVTDKMCKRSGRLTLHG